MLVFGSLVFFPPSYDDSERTERVTVGSGLHAFRWYAVDADLNNRLGLSRDSLTDSTTTSALASPRFGSADEDDEDDDSSEEGERRVSSSGAAARDDNSESSDAPLETDISKFNEEVKETLRRGMIEKHSIDNVALEINGLKFAYNCTVRGCGRRFFA